jgi:putative salt-induced outer membrane protein
MQKRFMLMPFLLVPVFTGAALASPIPPKVAQIIRVAAASGNSGELAAAAKLAKKTNPGAVAEIDALVAQQKAYYDARNRYLLSHQGFLEGWKGQGEAGGSNSTGNTRSTNIALGLNFTKHGLKWDQALDATVDYQRDNGKESKSRYFASYSGHYNIADRLYSLGLLSWEDDRFAGYDQRLSESVGFGYRILRGPTMNLAVEAGPALRQTDYIIGTQESKLAGRASMTYRWDILPNLTLTQAATYYAEAQDSTTTSDTGVTVKVMSNLSARASYHIQYESNPPLALTKTDTTTRLTLVYDF